MVALRWRALRAEMRPSHGQNDTRTTARTWWSGECVGIPCGVGGLDLVGHVFVASVSDLCSEGDTMSLVWKHAGTTMISECGVYRIEPGIGSRQGAWCLFIDGWESNPGFARFLSSKDAQTAAEIHDALRHAIDSTEAEVDSSFAYFLISLVAFFGSNASGSNGPRHSRSSSCCSCSGSARAVR
jgi:hypothetical protein